MKRYVKTKDGIYEYVGYDNECIIPSPIIKYKDELTHCCECDIIKQADTIEELCDEFVLDHHLFAPSCKTLYHSFEKAKELITAILGEKRTISEEEIKSKNRVDITLEEYEGMKKHISDLQEHIGTLNKALGLFVSDLEPEVCRLILENNQKGKVAIYENPASYSKNVVIMFDLRR